MQSGKRILYIIDNINYPSGAQKATALQIRQLRKKALVEIFSIVAPSETSKQLFDNIVVHTLPCDSILTLVNQRFDDVMKGKEFSFRQKVVKFCFAVSLRLGVEHLLWRIVAKKELCAFFASYDTVCVVSEASKMRDVVARCTCKRKIQWIHTDYAQWKSFSGWATEITRRDGLVYRQYDAIVCLTESIKAGFIQIYPHLANRTQVIGNLIDIESILAKAKEVPIYQVDPICFNIVTVGRLEQEKGYDRILRICAKLKEDGLGFHWYIVGDGSLKESLLEQHQGMHLKDVVTFTGQLNNPYPLMAQCNLFALLSHYEGLPVTIDEAMVLGLPVLATAVGGISEQLSDAQGCLLAEQEEPLMYQQIYNSILGVPNHCNINRDLILLRNIAIESACVQLLLAH